MNFGRIAWLVGVTLLVMIANVVVSILYMVAYSYVIDPGHDQTYYEAHVQVAAPYSSIVAGIPLMFLAGWWISGWWDGEHPIRSAVVVWLAYAVIDFSILLAAGLTSRIALLFVFSFITKLAAVVLGAIVGSRSRKAQ